MRAEVARFALCFLFPLLALAQRAGVEGRVLNSATGEPLRKAQVTLTRSGASGGRTGSARGEMPHATITDSEGRFTFKDIEPGQYRAQAERNGFVRVERRAGTLITLAPGQALQGVLLKLLPQAVIAGRVLDEDGEPLADAPVQALRITYAYGKRLVPAAVTTTNDLGEYRLHGLAPGRYYISASYRHYASVLNEGYVPAYFPGVTDPAAAGQLPVAAGDELNGIDLTLTKVKLLRVSGRVMNAADERSSGSTTITLVPRGSSLLPFERHLTAVSNPTRDFEIAGVPPGAYTITATLYSGRSLYFARQTVDVGDSNVEGVNLVITAGADVRGEVRIEGQAALNPAALRITLAPRGEGGGRPGSTAPVDAKGAFTLHNAGPDTYSVNLLNLPEDFYVKSVRMGGAGDILSAGLNLAQGTGAPLEVTLSAAGGRIEGVVLDDKQQAAASATVALLPGGRAVTTDQNGRFTVRGIAPGDYKLFAWEDAEPGAWQDPDFMKPYENAGEAVSVRESGRENVQLKLLR